MISEKKALKIFNLDINKKEVEDYIQHSLKSEQYREQHKPRFMAKDGDRVTCISLMLSTSKKSVVIYEVFGQEFNEIGHVSLDKLFPKAETKTSTTTTKKPVEKVESTQVKSSKTSTKPATKTAKRTTKSTPTKVTGKATGKTTTKK